MRYSKQSVSSKVLVVTALIIGFTAINAIWLFKNTIDRIFGIYDNCSAGLGGPDMRMGIKEYN